ncbi:C40 family peptidase [Flavobacterium sp. RHBU_24]|uniref:C40 family peptidase n=1 Tax=Flavobacterium sp. RHBU_24 TaxID=3391185 RepID=UPI0039846F9C
MKNILYIYLIAASLVSCNESKKRDKKISQLSVPQEVIVQSNEAVNRDSIIAFAKKYMGTKYCYASEDPAKGFDCSGFVHYVFKHFDINLPRSSSGFKDIGTAKKPKDFMVGDILVFYGYKDSNSIGHLGIITEANGMQSKFIHASSGSEMAVTVSELGSEGYTHRFYKCINPFAL